MEPAARLKQHRAGATGELVPGQEHLLKLTVFWNAIPDAQIYEVCLNCEIHDNERLDPTVGRLEVSDPQQTCGGRQCFIWPGADPGVNRVHVRVRTSDDRVSRWSDPGNFEVAADKIGFTEHIPHEEL